ncbi:hypothetical protein [Streptomyces sundarbansensis]
MIAKAPGAGAGDVITAYHPSGPEEKAAPRHSADRLTTPACR